MGIDERVFIDEEQMAQVLETLVKPNPPAALPLGKADEEASPPVRLST